jgi:hypothetical protein
MKKLFIVLILVPLFFAALVLGSIWYIINSGWFIEKGLPFAFSKIEPSISIPSLTVERTQATAEGRYEINAFALSFVTSDIEGNVSFEEFSVASFWYLMGLSDSAPALFTLSNFQYSQKDLDINGLSFDAKLFLKNKADWHMQGTSEVSEAVFSGYRITDFSAPFEFSPDLIRISNIEASMYEGSIVGALNLLPKEDGTFTLTLNIAGLNTVQLAKDKPDQFSQLQGIANGTVKVEGNKNGIRLIVADIMLQKNANIRARLLEGLVPYLPEQSLQRKDLEGLIRADEMVSLDKAVIHAENMSLDSISATIRIYSERFNLDINLSVDFNVEGGLDNLFTLSDSVFKPKK